jgi:hypothetical protein
MPMASQPSAAAIAQMQTAISAAFHLSGDDALAVPDGPYVVGRSGAIMVYPAPSVRCRTGCPQNMAQISQN